VAKACKARCGHLVLQAARRRADVTRTARATQAGPCELTPAWLLEPAADHRRRVIPARLVNDVCTCLLIAVLIGSIRAGR
jgi:hypothetical protein